MYYENYENVVAQKNNEQKYILKELPTKLILHIFSAVLPTRTLNCQKISHFNIFQVGNTDFSQPLNSIHKDIL